MAATVTQLSIKNAAGAEKSLNVIDMSGTGLGPFVPLHGLIDKLGALIDGDNPLPVALPSGYALDATLAAIRDKLIAAPATEAKQNDIIAAIEAGASTAVAIANAADPTLIEASEATLSVTLAGLLRVALAPGAATDAKLDDLIALLGTQAGYLDGVEGSLTSLLAKYPAALGSNGGVKFENVATVAYTSQVDFTRPANTTNYTAGDVVTQAAGGAIEFQNAAPAAGGEIMITGAEMMILDGALISGENYRWELYSSLPASNYADNAAWDLPSGDRAAYLGDITIGIPVDKGATLYVAVDQVNKHIKAASSSIWAYPVTVGAFNTPPSGRAYRLKLHTADFR